MNEKTSLKLRNSEVERTKLQQKSIPSNLVSCFFISLKLQRSFFDGIAELFSFRSLQI